MAETQVQSRVDQMLATLIRLRKPTGKVLLGLAAGLACLFVWLGFQVDTDARLGFNIDWDFWPEALGAACLAIVALGAGLWCLLAPEEQVTPVTMRLAVLAVGGLCGLTVFVTSLGRAGRWWGDIFSGGLQGWQGEEGYKLWICIAEGIIGLAIMFVSLLLARSEERSNVGLRRLLYGYNATLCGLLLLAILVIANVMVHFLWPSTFQWTKTRGLYTLSSRTKNILANLKDEVWVYVIMPQQNRIFDDVRTLLENCQAETNKLTVKMYSPDLNVAEVKDLVERLPALQVTKVVDGVPRQQIERGIALVKGQPRSAGETLIAFLPWTSLFEVEGGPQAGREEQGRTLSFKGEDVLISALHFWLEGGKKPNVYFTQDNEEPQLDRGYFTILKSHLERSKYQVFGLRLRDPPPRYKADGKTVIAKEVPKDADIVVIGQPLRPFSSQALAALRRYMAQNGRLFVLLGIHRRRLEVSATGLEKLLADFLVEVPRAYVLRNNPNRPFEVRAFPPEDSTNPIAKAMQGKGLLLDLVRPVRSLSGSRKFQVDPVLQVLPEDQVWVDNDLRTIRNPIGAIINKRYHERQPTSAKPIPVAMAVTDSTDSKPRVVVCGNMDFATLIQSSDPVYYDFVLNCLQWLRGRATSLGEQPLKSNFFTLNVPSLHPDRMVFLPAWLMLASIIGLGVGIWVVRRR